MTSSNELVNTQTATVSSTLNFGSVESHAGADAQRAERVTFLPGVNTTGINRDSTINGLPESMINITLDGVSNSTTTSKHGRVLRVP